MSRNLKEKKKRLNNTNHSLVRAQQRGIREETKETILKFHDYSERCGKGSKRIMVKRKKIKILVGQRVITPQEADRVKNTYIIIAENDNIITNAHAIKRFKKNRVIHKRQIRK